jgi:phage-related minor tail protein
MQVITLTFNAKEACLRFSFIKCLQQPGLRLSAVLRFRKRAGVFGEAGPEAIMPLTRAGDGSLGVRAVGGGQNAGASEGPKVYITIEGGNTSRRRRLVLSSLASRLARLWRKNTGS